MLKDIDEVVEAARKRSGSGEVSMEGDMDVVLALYALFKKYFPIEHREFLESAELIRSAIALEGTHGFSKDGDGFIAHQLEIPQKFHLMMRSVFPKLTYDRTFVRKLVQVIPEFKVTDARI